MGQVMKEYLTVKLTAMYTSLNIHCYHTATMKVTFVMFATDEL